MIDSDEINEVRNGSHGNNVERGNSLEVVGSLGDQSETEFVVATMINDSDIYHIGNESTNEEYEESRKSMLSHQLSSSSKENIAKVPEIDEGNYSASRNTTHTNGVERYVSNGAETFVQSITHPTEVMGGAPVATIAGKKRKSETGLANVSMKTVMRWRGKEGIDIDCLLGATTTSTVLERTRAEEILNGTGQLLCILCAQSISGNKKSVRRHQLKNAKHLVRLNDVSNGQPFPSTDAAMNIVVPLPYVPLDLAVSTASRGCQEAWEIVKNAEKAHDFAGLSANLESLGKIHIFPYFVLNRPIPSDVRFFHFYYISMMT